MMVQQSIQSELLNLFQKTHQQLMEFIQSRPEAERTEQGTAQQWAAKDILAQIGFWMDYTVERMGYYQRGEPAPQDVDFNALFLRVFEVNQARSWAEMADYAERAWASLNTAVQQAPEELLSVENSYGSGASGIFWREISANGFIWPLQELEKFYLRKGDAAQAGALHALVNNRGKDSDKVVSALIEPKALQEKLQSALPPLIIDVRGSAEYKAGHLHGAINIPLTDLAEQLADLPTDRPIVTYCNMHHPGQSRGERAAVLLTDHGFPAAALNGGLPAWKKADFPIEQAKETV